MIDHALPQHLTATARYSGSGGGYNGLSSAAIKAQCVKGGGNRPFSDKGKLTHHFILKPRLPLIV